MTTKLLENNRTRFLYFLLLGFSKRCNGYSADDNKTSSTDDNETSGFESVQFTNAQILIIIGVVLFIYFIGYVLILFTSSGSSFNHDTNPLFTVTTKTRAIKGDAKTAQRKRLLSAKKDK